MKSLSWGLAVLLVFGALLAAGCGSKDTAGGTGGVFEDIDWELLSYRTEGGMQGVPLDIDVDARFEQGRVSGSSGVNTYSASYESSGSKLEVSQAVSTMMAGPEEAMRVEQGYLAALALSSTYTATGDTLTIFDEDGRETLSYSRGEAAELTGITWEATSYNNGRGAVVGILSGTSITAVFSEDGALSGNAGVNNYTSTYRTEKGSMTISAPASTKMAGDPEAMTQEDLYLSALPATASYTIRGGELQLRSEDGALVASYRPGQ